MKAWRRGVPKKYSDRWCFWRFSREWFVVGPYRE